MPTDAEIIRVFEKTLIGGYSCVNTRMAFDTEIFLKDNRNKKVLFKTEDGQVKRFSSKIIKMDENNQHGFAMTKPLPYGCIKKKKTCSNLQELTEILAGVTLDDKLGHLFVVDIEFADVNKNTSIFNEMYPPMFKKNKKIDPHERSCSQIKSRAQIKKRKNKEDQLFSLPFNSKTHSALRKKIFIPLYAEDLYFLTTRAGRKVTKVYDHYTFKLDTFKKDFVVMNQNNRKTAKTKVEKDFYKLLNNSNFGNDCRNNIGNCSLELTFDGFEEIAYIKKYLNIFTDPKFREFFSADIFREHAEREYQKNKKKYNKDDRFYEFFMEDLELKRVEDLESIPAFENKKRKITYVNSKKVDSIERKITECQDMRKNKMVIEFNDFESSSVKTIAVKSNNNIKCTSRYMSGKLLMLCKAFSKIFYLFAR